MLPKAEGCNKNGAVSVVGGSLYEKVDEGTLNFNGDGSVGSG